MEVGLRRRGLGVDRRRMGRGYRPSHRVVEDGLEVWRFECCGVEVEGKEGGTGVGFFESRVVMYLSLFSLFQYGEVMVSS